MRCQIDLGGSSFDTQLAVYTGSALLGLTLVTKNDDCALSLNNKPHTVQSCAVFQSAEGTVLYIQVRRGVGAALRR